MHRRAVAAILMFLFASVCALSQSQVNGIITHRWGDTLVVKSPETGKSSTVVLTSDTKTKDNKGLLGVPNESMADTVLIPGLKVQVDAAPDTGGGYVAQTITVDGDDLETSQMIEAGVHPTARATAANTQEIEEHARRFTALSEYDVKGQATVNFDVGSATISQTDQQELQRLARSATGLKAYMVAVTGYADSSGSAAMNTQLSEDRAKVVVIYLMQQGNVPVQNIVAPGAMGEYGSAASNETSAGRAANRRVEVKVLVNKGVAGGY
jgi:outer membrane protein OmpA-like peptidoglycan-associated protein